MFYLLHAWPAVAYVTFTLAFTAAAIALHDWGDRLLETKDSRLLVWDEIAGFLVAVAFVPFTWRLAIIAFLVQRCLDIVKVPPASWIEKRWPGGWGVVGDDLLAGAYTCTLLHFLIRFAPVLAGLTP
jgi:phosphatidylglycerophosphatase A